MISISPHPRPHRQALLALVAIATDERGFRQIEERSFDYFGGETLRDFDKRMFLASDPYFAICFH